MITCDREVDVTVVSLLPPRRHTQEPARVELCEGADQQGPVGLLVMPEEKGALKSASQPPGSLGNPPLPSRVHAMPLNVPGPAAGQRDTVSPPFHGDS